MNIEYMHIGIDLGLQAINSNVFGKLQRQEKDYFINTVTQEFVKAVLLDEKNTVFDLVSYSDIRKYYEVLQVYIRDEQLYKIDSLGNGYVLGALPSSITITSITEGVLYDGVTYKVIIDGTTDLSTFGYKTQPVIGETFTCNIDEQTGTSISIVSGEKYRIINAHTGVFTSVGATDNYPGTEFTATSDDTIIGGVSTVIQNLTKAPDWADTTLIPTSDIGYYMNIKSSSSVIKGSPITSGGLTIGKKYIVDTVGSTSLATVGGVITPDEGYIFACTSSDSLTWTGGTILYEIDDNKNRLVKAQDVDDFLQNSFGTVITSPISILANNYLRVYTGNKFDIERLFLQYIRKPIEVSYTDSIDSDLPDSVQPFLIDLVVKKISALSGNPNYNAIQNEVNDIKQ